MLLCGLLFSAMFFAAMGAGLRAESLPDGAMTRKALEAGFLRVDEYSIQRVGEKKLVFTMHAEPEKYGYGAFWILPAIFLIWKVYRRIREKPRNWWRKLGWKLNLGIPIYIFFAALTTGSGMRYVLDAKTNTFKHETTWAGLGINTLEESPLTDAKALRILTLTKDKHRKQGDAKFALAIEWGAGAEPDKVFILKTKSAKAKTARELLRALEVHASDVTGVRRFQK